MGYLWRGTEMELRPNRPNTTAPSPPRWRSVATSPPSTAWARILDALRPLTTEIRTARGDSGGKDGDGLRVTRAGRERIMG
jgi:hypothetical protein